ncbi:MAG TPA: DUF2252 family protein, partial [Paraburkholderia sp.]
MDKAVSRKTAHAANAAPAPYRTPDERAAQGRLARDKVPRSSQAGWKLPDQRRDVIELLDESNAGRLPRLIPIRFGRMSASPFAFYRGA